MLPPPSASAQQPELSNQTLGDSCAGRGRDSIIALTRKGFCTGVIAGAIAAHRIAVAKRGARALFCAGEQRLDVDELTFHYLDWLDEHPERLEEPGVASLLHVLGLLYPCPG